MRTRLLTIAMSTLHLMSSAAASTLIDQLPACWQTCIEKHGQQCDYTDIHCLCHSAASPIHLPTVLTCVRKTCNTKYYPEFLTAPLQTIQTACRGTKYGISHAAVSKADAAAYSAAASAEGEGATRKTTTRKVPTATRTTVTSMGPPLTTIDTSMTSIASAEGEGATRKTTTRKVPTAARTTVTSMGPPSTTIDTSMTSIEIVSKATTSTTASSPAANVEPTIGASTVLGPLMTFPASSAPRTSASTSVSQKTGAGDGGGTPLDVGQQSAGVSKRAGSSLCLAIALVAVAYS